MGGREQGHIPDRHVDDEEEELTSEKHVGGTSITVSTDKAYPSGGPLQTARPVCVATRTASWPRALHAPGRLRQGQARRQRGERKPPLQGACHLGPLGTPLSERPLVEKGCWQLAGLSPVIQM